MSKNILLMSLVALPLAASATEYRMVEQPRQECWNEQVPVQVQDYTGAILGGIAGGILGNQVGGGSGRAVATAAGAMAGAVTGERMSNSRPGYQTVQRCRTVVEHVRVPIIQPTPVYQAPPAVYAPPSVYVQPQPVYVQPQPVVVQPEYGYYAVPDARYGDYWRRAHWRRHHHHRDDDDD